MYKWNEKDLFMYKNLMKWNISVIRGKKTNKYSVSTGEGKWKKNKYFFKTLRELW